MPQSISCDARASNLAIGKKHLALRVNHRNVNYDLRPRPASLLEQRGSIATVVSVPLEFPLELGLDLGLRVGGGDGHAQIRVSHGDIT